MSVKDQQVFTLAQKSQWVDIVDAAQRDDRMKCRTSFERYVRKYPKLVGFGLLYGYLIIEDALLSAHPNIKDPIQLLGLAHSVSGQVVHISPMLDVDKVATIMRVALGLEEYEPSDSNEMLFALIVVAALLPPGRGSIIDAVNHMEELVLETLAEPPQTTASTGGGAG